MPLLILRNGPCKKGKQEYVTSSDMQFIENKLVFTAFDTAFKYNL
jgi:hypothetical protein